MNEINLRKIDLNLLYTLEILMQERSVSRAAERMGLTQSALSHALARLRELTGDPLLIKSGSRMTPSNRALALIEQIRPILRSIERVLVKPTDFVPKTSKRCFRLFMPDMAIAVFPRLLSIVQAQGPNLGIEWASGSGSLLLEVADGQLDAAIIPAFLKLPEGVAHQPIGAFEWACYVRKDHPALRKWNVDSWSKWPHVAVRMGHKQDQNPAHDQYAAAGLKRNIAAWVPQFTAIAPTLARTNFIATLPRITMSDALKAYGLVQMPTPIPLEPIEHRLIWGAAQESDPASQWIRLQITSAFAELMIELKSDM